MCALMWAGWLAHGPTQQIGLGITQPQVEPNEEDDERTESDEVQHPVAEPMHNSQRNKYRWRILQPTKLRHRRR
jgi:hypothetical protein